MSKLKMKRKRLVCHRCNATHEYPRTYLTYKDGYDGEYPNIANVDDCLDAIKYADTVIEAEGSET